MTPTQECPRQDNGLCKHKNSRKGSLLQRLGPGFITGASDDDPSGLTTYAQAGAQFGKKILWFAPWSLPLMISVQEMAGRIGLMTQGGLSRALLQKFPRIVVYCMVACLIIANTINIGADIAGMAESVEMTTKLPFVWSAIILSIGMLILQIYLPYKKYINILKWCTISLFSYIVAAFTIKMGWASIAWHTMVPQIKLASNDFWTLLVAMLGTTISPYLMFWQASQEIEEKRVRDERENRQGYAINDCEISNMREETFIGMFFSNIIMFFVIAVTAAVLYAKGGASTISSMVEAAEALRPLAGDMAAWLFGFGIIGTGLMSVPVLAASSGYAVAELFGLRHGLHLEWHEAKEFYGVIAASTVIGLALNGLGINAVDFLIWSAIINGCVTPIIIVGMIVVANDGNLLGNFKNTWLTKAGGWLTFSIFSATIAGFLLTYTRQSTPYEKLWLKETKNVAWFKAPTRVLDWREPIATWFGDGELNASHACVDVHVTTERKEKTALIWENEEGLQQSWSYADLFKEVNRIADGLKRLGVKKSDSVIIYMPTCPEAVATMLAAARLGATHSVIFSGFKGQALKERIEDTKARIIVTADISIRRHQELPLKSFIDKALEGSKQIRSVLVLQRKPGSCSMMPGRDHFFHEMLSSDPNVYIKPEPVTSSHPLFVLYTSGTTGKPKGILHSTGGYLTFVRSTLSWTFGLNDTSVYWCTADLGWITGHSYVVYGPLQLGATVVLYDGAPDVPDLGRWWDIVEKYKVTALYTSPTALRMFMRHGEELPNNRNLSSLQMLGSVGEVLNPEVYDWYESVIGKGRCPVIDTWWQTETGGMMIAPMPLHRPMKLKAGSVSRPLPGIDAEVVDVQGNPVPRNTKGYLVIKTPWPGMSIGILGDHERFTQTYWTKFPGMYYTGDYAVRDHEGYFWLLGRADEVLKISGHRIGTAEIESALVALPQIAESAAIGISNEISGESLVLFVTLRKNIQQSQELKDLLITSVREQIGSFITPQAIYFVDQLPKTRSGKIMRRLLKALAENKDTGDTSTLEEEAPVEEVRKLFETLKSKLA